MHPTERRDRDLARGQDRALAAEIGDRLELLDEPGIAHLHRTACPAHERRGHPDIGLSEPTADGPRVTIECGRRMTQTPSERSVGRGQRGRVEEDQLEVFGQGGCRRPKRCDEMVPDLIEAGARLQLKCRMQPRPDVQIRAAQAPTTMKCGDLGGNDRDVIHGTIL